MHLADPTRYRWVSLTLWALIVLALVLSPLLGLLTPYVSLIFVIPLFFVTLLRGEILEAYSSYEARAFLAAFAAIALICVLTAGSVADGLRAFNFTMLLAYGPLVRFMRRQAGRLRAERIAQLAAIGVTIGLAEVALSAVLSTLGYLHLDRPTGPAIGPIVLSNGLLALGFMSLGGALVRTDARAWLYLLGPVGAIGATLITGSRGPLIGASCASIAAAIFLWRLKSSRSVLGAVLVLASLGLAGMVGALIAFHTRAGSLVDIGKSLLSGGAVADENTRQRLVLYEAGIKSFQQSPWIGHGWGRIMRSVRPLLPQPDIDLGSLPQLHNDVLNFAVGAGVVGVVCYVAIVTAPILGALGSPRDDLRTFRLFGATMLTIIYVGGGLTDLMFGFEYHTYLFAMLTAILIGFCRTPRVAN